MVFVKALIRYSFRYFTFSLVSLDKVQVIDDSGQLTSMYIKYAILFKNNLQSNSGKSVLELLLKWSQRPSSRLQ